MNRVKQMPDQTKHIISHYDAALYALRNDVVMMFKLTDRLLETALAALLNRDCELCKQAIIQEEEIKTFGKKIDREGLSLLVLFHPVATDMTSCFWHESQRKLGAHQ